MPAPMLFERAVGIDYSGAGLPDKGLPGLRVYMYGSRTDPQEIAPVSGKYWSRQGLARWLEERLCEPVPTIVGLDHGFSFPLAYFRQYDLPLDWNLFLNDFCRHWPADTQTVESIRRSAGGQIRTGSARWRRECERRAGAKSVFHFDVPGSVAKSTHAGLPWLHLLRRRLGPIVHCWPFDGWTWQPGQSVITEIYPSLWHDQYPREGRTPDQHDAYSAARWLWERNQDGTLAACCQPHLAQPERDNARVEGWIPGVGM